MSLIKFVENVLAVTKAPTLRVTLEETLERLRNVDIAGKVKEHLELHDLDINSDSSTIINLTIHHIINASRTIRADTQYGVSRYELITDALKSAHALAETAGQPLLMLFRLRFNDDFRCLIDVDTPVTSYATALWHYPMDILNYADRYIKEYYSGTHTEHESFLEYVWSKNSVKRYAYKKYNSDLINLIESEKYYRIAWSKQKTPVDEAPPQDTPLKKLYHTLNKIYHADQKIFWYYVGYYFNIKYSENVQVVFHEIGGSLKYMTPEKIQDINNIIKDNCTRGISK